MSLFRTLRILCKIQIYFHVVYIHLLNRCLLAAVVTSQNLGDNFQLATNEIPLLPVVIRRPFPLCFPWMFPKELMQTLWRFVWPSRAKWAKGNFTGSGWYLQWFLIWLRSYFLWILDTHQGIHIPNLKYTNLGESLKSCSTIALPPLESMTSSQSSQGAVTDQCLLLQRIQS